MAEQEASGDRADDVRAALSTPSVRLAFGDLPFTLEGWSVGGVETWLVVPQWSLAIDCGRIANPSLRCRRLALTHAHLDHAGAIAGWLGLRSMFGMAPAEVYAPAEVCDDLERVVAIWSRLQGVELRWTLHRCRAGERFGIGGNRWLVALAAHHGVPALGWAVVEQRAHLLPALHGLDGPEIAARKRRGEVITRQDEIALLAISGDTRASMAAAEPLLQRAAVVLHEVTLLDARHEPARAHAGGHSHLDDLRDTPVAAEARYFVPYHISQRYDAASARIHLGRALGERFGARLLPLLPPAKGDEIEGNAG